MTITVSKLKRALEKTAADPSFEGCVSATDALRLVMFNPHALTILAEKLSERPGSNDDAPGAAYREAQRQEDDDVRRALQDQRDGGPPASYIARKDCPTALGDACTQGSSCCQRAPLILDHRTARVEQARKTFEPGQRVRYTYAINPLRHKGGQVVAQRGPNNVIVLWDDYARPTWCNPVQIDHEPAEPTDEDRYGSHGQG